MLFAVVANLLRDYDQVVHRAKLNLQNRDWIGLQRDDQELAMLHDRLDAGIAKLMRDEIVKEAFRHPRREAHRIARRER